MSYIEGVKRDRYGDKTKLQHCFVSEHKFGSMFEKSTTMQLIIAVTAKSQQLITSTTWLRLLEQS